MGINDLSQYLASHIPETFYPLSFSASSPDECSVVSFTGGNPVSLGLSRVFVQIITRAKHPATAEAKALQIKDFLNNKTNFDVGNSRVVFVSAQNPMPLYLGTDENGRYKYSLNYLFLMEV